MGKSLGLCHIDLMLATRKVVCTGYICTFVENYLHFLGHNVTVSQNSRKHHFATQILLLNLNLNLSAKYSSLILFSIGFLNEEGCESGMANLSRAA